jgi:hypothetical protein
MLMNPPCLLPMVVSFQLSVRKQKDAEASAVPPQALAAFARLATGAMSTG